LAPCMAIPSHRRSDFVSFDRDIYLWIARASFIRRGRGRDDGRSRREVHFLPVALTETVVVHRG
jgi:hypothetical protein